MAGPVTFANIMEMAKASRHRASPAAFEAHSAPQKPASSASPASSLPKETRVSQVSLNLESQSATLTIRRSGHELAVEPKSIVLAKPGSIVWVKSPSDLAPLSLFVRDEATVSLDRAKGRLTAHRAGRTELYAVSQGKMVIIPMTVASGAELPALKLPQGLVSLDGMFSPVAQASLSAAATAGSLSSTLGSEGTSVASSSPQLSLRASVAETEKALAAQQEVRRAVALSQTPVAYIPVSIQVVDDRSNSKDGRLYPVANAHIRVVGTAFRLTTNATGHVTMSDVPKGSRLQVLIDDEAGTIVPGVAVIEAREGVTRVRVMRSFMMGTLQGLLQTAQSAEMGSFCAALSQHNPGESVAGIAAAVDPVGERPVYFNQLGLPDAEQGRTGQDGRLCILNVAPGPVALTLSDQEGDSFATVPVPVQAGRHLELDLTIDQEVPLKTQLVVAASAGEQLSGDTQAPLRYSPIDTADLIPLGSDTSMLPHGPGVVASAEPLLPVHGRIQAMAQGAEIEPALYQFQTDAKVAVTPLIPRGFVDDMAVYAQVAHDSALGSVLVEFGHPSDLEGSVNMRLVDHTGRDVGDGWYFHDQPLTKAIFFNVPPGVYTLMVETQDRYWLAVETLDVYSESLSYLNLGSRLKSKVIRMESGALQD